MSDRARHEDLLVQYGQTPARPEATRAQHLADLATLEALWRKKLDPTLLY